MFLKTKDVAEIFGVTQNTIRSWELKGILIPAYKSPTGRRGYTKEQINTLLERGYNHGSSED